MNDPPTWSILLGQNVDLTSGLHLPSGREMLVFSELFLVNEGAQIPARQPHLEAVVPHVVEGGDGENLPDAAALELLRHDGGEEVQDGVRLPAEKK